MTSKLSKVDVSKPPITETAMGLRNEPSLAPSAKATGNMPAVMAMVVMMMGRARLWQASNMASRRDMCRSRLATMAYSTSKIEFLVAMPMSITSPIIEGIDSALPVTSSPKNAPPSDKGRATKMVMGCKKSLNNNTSTKSVSYTHLDVYKRQVVFSNAGY